MDTLEWHLSLLTSENIVRSSTQEQELGYHWVMHLKNACIVKKGEDTPLLSLWSINRMQNCILGFQTIYLPTYLTWLCCCSWLSTWFEHIYSRLKRTSQKPNLEILYFLYWTNCVQVWRVKKMQLLGNPIKRSTGVE